LKRELDRYRFDNEPTAYSALDEIQADLEKSYIKKTPVRNIPRSQTPLINYRPGDSSKIEFKVPLPKPANCSSERRYFTK
jgi:hypothetical protein